jgi:ethanolamine transporter EutH
MYLLYLFYNQSVPLQQWIKCILLGALSLPLGCVMRLLPVTDAESDFAGTYVCVVCVCMYVCVYVCMYVFVVCGVWYMVYCM